MGLSPCRARVTTGSINIYDTRSYKEGNSLKYLVIHLNYLILKPEKSSSKLLNVTKFGTLSRGLKFEVALSVTCRRRRTSIEVSVRKML